MTQTQTYELIKTIVGEAKDTLAADYDYDAVIAFCDEKIEAIAAKAEKAKAKAAEKRAEKNEVREAIYKLLSGTNYMTIPDIVTALGDPDVTVSKATYQLNSLVKEDQTVEKTDVVVDGRKIKGFRKIGA